MKGKGGRKLRSAYRSFKEWFAETPLQIFPFRSYLKGYSRETAKFDLKASVNVALLAIPQGMAYAAIAELPILYGIICSAVASIVAPLFASSRQTILGPTNATSLMVFSFFAAQGLAVLRDLGIADDDPRVNPNGGAIALGHPLGASGARLVTTAVNQLHACGGRYALCTMCVGVGQGIAIILERV